MRLSPTLITRYTLAAGASWLMACSCLLAACQAVPNAQPIARLSPEAARAQSALDRWPQAASAAPAINRPFFATIHAVGQRVTASGILEYHSAVDFRITAATEMGVILFDARMNWANVTVLRKMPNLDQSTIETLVADLSRAGQPPKSLEGLKAGNEKMILQQTLSDTHEYTWIFDRTTGRLLQTDINMGPLDTLHIYYKTYNTKGWPEEIQIVRRLHLFEISFSFTDDTMAQLRTNH